MDQKKKVVILGGGNGGSISIRAMKQFPNEYSISAIIAMSDSGRSSGKFRKELGVLPPADIIRAVLAMSPHDYNLLRRIFYDTRVEHTSKLNGLAVGHLFVALTTHYYGSILNAIDLLSRAVDSVGQVFPVTLQLSDLCVQLSNGKKIVGEGVIDRPKWDRSVKIVDAWLEPVTVPLYTKAKKEILEADIIIIGPGSFYTSIIPTLLPRGMKKAIADSKAKLIFVSGNVVESNGETGPTSTSEIIGILHTYLPREVDVVISNTAVLNSKQRSYYQEKGWEKIVIDHNHIDVPIIAAPFELSEGGYDPVVLGRLIHKYISK